MDASWKRVLRLAEQSDWDEVLLLVALDAAHAQAQDDFGMLPLHWACSETSVDLGVVSTLIHAFPGACHVKNLSGMLPLHVAIQAKASGLLISALLDVHPQAALVKDGNGRYPVDLAISSSLPHFTINLIRKTCLQTLQSASKLSMSSMDGQTSVDSSNNSQSKEDVSTSMTTRSSMSLSGPQSLIRKPCTASSAMDPVDANTISLQLKDLLLQLHQLSLDIRVSNTSPSSLTYRSSFSSAFSPNVDGLVSVLWNTSDRLGIILEPAMKETGAKIKSFSSRSDVLGVELLAVGDVLKNINGVSVVDTSCASIMRFLKHSKTICKLQFAKGFDTTTTRKCSTSSNPAVEQDNVIYSRVVEMLETTLKKVSAVEETVRLSSTVSLHT